MKNIKTLAIIGCDAPSSVVKGLSSLGFEPLLLPSEDRLQAPVRSHADMLICVMDDRVFCSVKYFNENPCIFDRIKSYGYTVTPCDTAIGEKYPEDIAFNLIYTKNSLIGKLSHSAKEITEYANTNNIKNICVNQGYAKCSTLLLDQKGVICADDGIINAARSIGLEALKISNTQDSIDLPGYTYGFIGGASGVLDKKVYFCGDVTKHPQEKEIAEFCEKLGFEVISLCSEKLYDVGGITFLPPLL